MVDTLATAPTDTPPPEDQGPTLPPPLPLPETTETPPELTTGYVLAEGQSIVPGDGFQAAEGYVVPVSQQDPEVVAQAAPEPPEGEDAKEEPGFFGSIVETVKESAQDGVEFFQQLPKKVDEALKPSADAAEDVVTEVYEDLSERAVDAARYIWNFPGAAVEEARKGIQRTLGRDEPNHYDADAPREPIDPSLVEVSSGILYAPDFEEPSAQELDGGYYGFAGVPDEGGTVRAYFGLPTRQDYDRVELIAPVGSVVEEGDAVYRLVDDALNREIATLEAQIDGDLKALPSIISDAARDLSGSDADIARQERSISGLERQIDAQKSQVEVAERYVDRVGFLVEEGAQADVQLDRAVDALRKEEEELARLEGDLAAARADLDGLEAQRAALADLENLSPEALLDKVASGDTAALPPSVVRAANAILVDQTTLDGKNAEKASLVYYSPVRGEVSAQVPEGVQFNSLDGSVKLNDNTASSLGDVPEDAERIQSSDANDGSTPTVVPADDLPAEIVFGGVSPTQAEQFDDNELVSFITADGRQGTGRVRVNTPYTQAAGHRLILTDATFLDGTPLTAGEREPIRIFDELKPRIEQEWPTGEPETAAAPAEPVDAASPIERDGESSDTVTFLDPTAPKRDPGELWVAEQEFEARIPIWGRSEENPEIEPRIIGYLDVTGTVRSDRRAVRVDNVVGTVRTLDGTTVPYDVNIEVDLAPIGSSTGTDPTLGGSPREDSGVRLKVSVPIVSDNATLADADGLQVQVGPEGFIGSGTWSSTGTQTALPRNQQLQVPIDVVPTGRLSGELAQITTPSAIAADVDERE